MYGIIFWQPSYKPCISRTTPGSVTACDLYSLKRVSLILPVWRCISTGMAISVSHKKGGGLATGDSSEYGNIKSSCPITAPFHSPSPVQPLSHFLPTLWAGFSTMVGGHWSSTRCRKKPAFLLALDPHKEPIRSDCLYYGFYPTSFFHLWKILHWCPKFEDLTRRDLSS